jgi:hypothetical protein
MDLTPSFPTVLCVAGLTLLAAVIAGGVPAVHATGRWRQSRLLQRIGGQVPGTRLGWAWTTLLAVQIGLSLAVVPTAIEMALGIFRPAIVGPALPVHEFLTASLVSGGEADGFDDLRHEVVRRLAAEPGVTGVAASATGLMEEPFDDIEIEGKEPGGDQARFNAVDAAFFDVFGARFLAGRAFEAGDFAAAAVPAIVNRSFVNELVEGRIPLGRRVRFLRASRFTRALVWHDIVGVVDDFPGNNDGPKVFLPLVNPVPPIALTIRAPSDLAPAASSARAIPPAVDPNLRAAEIRSLADEYWLRQSADRVVGYFLGTVTAIVLLLSMAGVYTMTTFIVAQRWREIGLRSALGAGPRRLVAGIVGRALVPLGVGVAAGSALAVVINSAVPVAEAGGQPITGIVPLSAVLMVFAALLATAGPARRALRIDPTEALRVN